LEIFPLPSGCDLNAISGVAKRASGRGNPDAYDNREVITPLPGYLLVLNWPVSIPGGVNEAVLGLAQDLKAHGYHPIIGVASWSKDAQPEEFRGIDVASLRLREPFAEGAGLRLLPGFLRTLIADARALLAFLRFHNIQVVNSCFPSLNISSLLLLKSLGAYRGKLILTFHGADIQLIGRTSGLLRKVWLRVIGQADGVAACSEALRREVLRVAPGARVVTIHNGVDRALFACAREPRPRLRRILHIGKFEHKKAQDIVLQAFRRILRDFPDARLQLVGAEGPALAETRMLISGLGLAQSVELHVNAPHEQVPAFMQAADIFVLPSRLEPFGIVLLEAGVSGLPVIATRVGGIPELIEHEQTGLLIAPDDAAALESAIRRLMADRPLAEALARRWQQRVLATWSWRTTGQKHIELVQQKSVNGEELTAGYWGSSTDSSSGANSA
jgi:glycosyltransferase involved in cell wall biosynthesis